MIRFCQTAAEFQAALNAAVAGDIIRLDRTKTFQGNFTCPNRGVFSLANPIIIESDTPTELLPAPGYRIFPSYSGVLAKIRSGNTSSALKFASPTFGWLVRNTEFLANSRGFGNIITIGNNDDTQTEYSQIPSDIMFDRCLIRGDRLAGQKVGIMCRGNNFKLHNCYISDMKGHGQDAYCLGVINCQGPIEVLNNYLEGAGYCTIVGGSDPRIRTVATVLATPAPTSSSATLSTIKDLSVGQMIAVLYTNVAQGNVLYRKHTYITAINTTTNRVDFTDIGVVPDSPGDVRWGVHTANLTFRRNHYTKQDAWRNPILGTPSPTNPVVTPGPSGLAAGTYYYVLQAIGGGPGIGYQDTVYNSDISSEKIAGISQTSTVTLSWSAVSDATKYRIYRYQKDAAGNRINARYYETVNLSFTDVNATGTVFTNFTGASFWVIKNLFELKNGVTTQVDSNIFENKWKGGYAFWLKSNNQDGAEEFARLRNLMIEKNIIRNTDGAFSLSGSRASGEAPADKPETPHDVTFRNNLVYASSIARAAMQLAGGAPNVLIDHNHLIHNSNAGIYMQPIDPVVHAHYFTNLIMRNNLIIRNTYGVYGSGGEGKASLENVSNNSYVFDRNVISGGSANVAAYTIVGATNYTPTVATFENQFKNFAGGGLGANLKLKRISEGDDIDSLYINAGTDGKDIGADIALVETATSGVIEGIPEISPEPTSNVSKAFVTFAMPRTAGEYFLELGFQPKALLFFYSLATGDGEISDFSLGMGCWAQDGTMWSGYSHHQHNVTPTKNAAYAKATTAIGLTDVNGLVLREVTSILAEPTGARLTFAVPNATAADYQVICLALGGTGVQNAKAFNFDVPTTLQTQDVNLGFRPDTLAFYAPVNTTTATPVPFVGAKSISMMLGFASSLAEQGFLSARLKNAESIDVTKRVHKNGSCIGMLSDIGIALEGNIQQYLASGFRLEYSIVSGESNKIFGLALRGPRSKFSIFTEPIANGQVNYAQGFRPEAVLLSSVLHSAGDSVQDNARLVIGGAASPTQRGTLWSGARHNVSPSIAKSALLRSRAFRGLTEQSGVSNILSEADLVGYSSTGYTLNWSGSPGSAQLLSFSIGSAPTIGAEFEALIEQDFEMFADLETGILLATTIDLDFEILATLSVGQIIHHALTQFFALRINLDVKREVDSGIVNALATDVDGTPVQFNKSFKDIDSITLTVEDTVQKVSTYRFSDVPNPTTFYVYVYNTAGGRVNGTVSWKARGIV